MKHLVLFAFVWLSDSVWSQSLLFVCDSSEDVIHYTLPDELLRPHFHCQGTFGCTQCAYADSAFRVIAGELNKLTVIGYDIIVHSDLRGSAAFNDSLSYYQALDIYKKLQKNGLDSAGATILGKGEREPLISEAVINRYKRDRRTYEELHAQNRRFELRVVFYDPATGQKQPGRE